MSQSPFQSLQASLSPSGESFSVPQGVDSDSSVAVLYRRAHRLAAPGQLVTALHMGTEHTVVATGLDPKLPSVVLTLSLGRQKTAHQFFRKAIPTPLELETAIAWVEDEVYAAHVRHRAWVPEGAAVMPCSTDASLHDIATLAGIAQGPVRTLPLDAMEHLFRRFAAVSEGRPVSQEGLPEDAAFAATLLVLRELMHHLPFATLTLCQDADGPSAD